MVDYYLLVLFSKNTLPDRKRENIKKREGELFLLRLRVRGWAHPSASSGFIGILKEFDGDFGHFGQSEQAKIGWMEAKWAICILRCEGFLAFV